MMTLYLIILLGVLLRKGYHAYGRALRSYRQDLRDHDSLREYLLGNGATRWQSLQPFFRHAVERAFRPWVAQWRLWAALLAFGLLSALISYGL
jgi:hypothetical protein